MRTSQKHPLQINDFALAGGHVGMTLCSGRKDPSLYGSDWNRDLKLDIDLVKIWGADIVISLVEAKEMEDFHVIELSSLLGRAGIIWCHLPIRDAMEPDHNWYAQWCQQAPHFHQCLERGGRILIHCKAGLERTAIAAALLQCERGESLEHALGTIAKCRANAGPLPHQKAWLASLLQEDNRLLALARACLFGGAIGDALGAEIEFWSLDEIQAKFPNGIDRILPHDGIRAAITDDTQMTLFTAEGMIEAKQRYRDHGTCHPTSIVHRALLRWLQTQGESSGVAEIGKIGLIEDPRLRHRRAPGLTCTSALQASTYLGQSAQNNSKGCGTIMRVAPIALCCTLDTVEQIADETSAITHGHQTGRDAARAFAIILYHVFHGANLEVAVQEAETLNLNAETHAAIRVAKQASRDGNVETVEKLGGGWTAEEALSIALYAAFSAKSFEHGLKIAVTHSGDSDSTGAIAGNLLGLIFPEQVMNHEWRRKIECSDLIYEISRDLIQ